MKCYILQLDFSGHSTLSKCNRKVNEIWQNKENLKSKVSEK